MSAPQRKEEPTVVEELDYLLRLLDELQEDIRVTRGVVRDVHDHFVRGSELDTVDVIENLEFVYYGGDADIGSFFDLIDNQMDKCQRLARALV